MQWQIAPASDARTWHRALEPFPAADVFFLPEYHRVYETHGDGAALAFIGAEGRERLFYPFFLRPITAVAGRALPERAFDVETARGQSGPLATTSDPAFLARAWAAYSEWCRESKVVAEFTRFHMYLATHKYAHPDCMVIRHAESVVVDLDRSGDALWASYPSVQRNMVRKALSQGLACEEVPLAEGLPAFRKLYEATMSRVGTGARANYSDAFFEALAVHLGDRVKLWAVSRHGHVISAALFLISQRRIYYDLAGSDAEERGGAPNNLLLHTVAGWGQARGFTSLFLGDGSGNPRLMRFKASLSHGRLTQYIGRRIQDRNTYDGLCRSWMKAKGVTELPAVTFPYRIV